MRISPVFAYFPSIPLQYCSPFSSHVVHNYVCTCAVSLFYFRQLTHHDFVDRICDLSGNLLSKLPKTFLELPNLCKLDLSDNMLTELPFCQPDIGTEFDVSFSISPKLKSIDCSKNISLVCPPPEIVESGGHLVAQYLANALRFHQIQSIHKEIALLQCQEKYLGGISESTSAEELTVATDPIGMLSSSQISEAGPEKPQTPLPNTLMDQENLVIDIAENLKAQLQTPESFRQGCTSEPKFLQVSGIGDLQQNKYLQLVATGTEGVGLKSLLDHIEQACTSRSPESSTLNHGQWQVLGASLQPVHLKVLCVRGSLLYTPDSKSYKWASRENFGKHVSGASIQSRLEQIQLRRMFQMHRAVFLLGWRVHTGSHDDTLNEYELDAATQMVKEIRRNSPHAHILVVPTVGDNADCNGMLFKSQCEKLKANTQEDSAHLFFLGGTDSTAICIQDPCAGTLETLKNDLYEIVTRSPFYGELLPSYIFNLRERLTVLKEAGSKFITLSEYKHQAKMSGVPPGEEALKMTTAVLQDLGDLKYFGEDADRDCNRNNLLNTVFLNLAWMMQVVNTLIDTDTTKLITFFGDRDPALSFLASVLVTDGIVHPRLVPFIWPALNMWEAWPGVNSELIVEYWSSDSDVLTESCGLHPVMIGTDSASLTSAHTACVGLHLGVVAKDAHYKVEGGVHQKVCEISSRHVQALRDFNFNYGPNFLDGSVTSSHNCLQPILVPKLADQSSWHPLEQLETAMQPFARQISRVHLPKTNKEDTLAVFEWIRVTRVPRLPAIGELSSQSCSATGLTAPKARQDSNICGGMRKETPSAETKKTVYQYQQEIPYKDQHSIAGQKTDIELWRTMRLSLKRHPADPPSRVGFASVLANSHPEQETGKPWQPSDPEQDAWNASEFWQVFENLHPAALGGSLHITHTIIVYRVSVISHASAGNVNPLFERVNKISDPDMNELTVSRMEFDHAVAYMLLSHSDGVGRLPSLLLGHSPATFLSEIRALYKRLTEGDRQKRNTIGEAIKALDGYLLSLDVGHNPSLKGIPTKVLCKFGSLDFLDCVGSKQVYGLPPEIAKLGGRNAMVFLRSANVGSKENKELQIIVMGNGEAGKSSLINCVTNKKNDTSVEIHEDVRTVGIEIREWIPEPFSYHDGHAVIPDGLKCRFLDLAGQSVYGCTNQFFLVPRALYIIAWRVLKPARSDHAIDLSPKMRELEGMIVNWMSSLQVRVPGASMVLVATHIDAASSEEVDKQCKMVEHIVNRKLDQIRVDACRAGVAALEVHNHGQSVKLNCLKGVGVPHLRRTLIEMAHELPWWKESIPESYFNFRLGLEKLREDPQKPRVWIPWAEYRQLALDSKIEEGHISLATSFLNDMAIIKYFGTVTPQGSPDDENHLLDTTVFISPAWIIDGLKGLIRHDRSTLMEYFHNTGTGCSQKTMLRHVNRLVSFGICDPILVHYLWPKGGNTGPGRDYWEWVVKNEKQDEIRLWPRLKSKIRNVFTESEAESEEDSKRAIALLEGCDFLYTKTYNSGRFEYIAPVLLVNDSGGKLDARSYSITDCPLKHTYTITGMVPGFFDRLLVRVRKYFSHVDHSKNTGVFYGRALKVQIFLVGQGDEDSRSASNISAPLRSSQGGGGTTLMKRANRNVPSKSRLQTCASDSFHVNTRSQELTSTLTVLTSTRKQQKLIAKELNHLHQFFPGMSVGPYHNEVMLSADMIAASQEPVHVRIVALNPGSASKVKTLLLQLDQHQRAKGEITLRIDAGAFDKERGEGQEKNMEKYFDFSSRVLLFCMEKVPPLYNAILEEGASEFRREHASKLKCQLKEYEQKHKCVVGTIINQELADFLARHCAENTDIHAKKRSESTQSPAKRSHKSAGDDVKQQNPCNQDAAAFIHTGAFSHLQKKLLEVIEIREHGKFGRVRPLMKWESSQKDFIAEIQIQTEASKRVMEQKLDTSLHDCLAQEVMVLEQLALAEQICRKCNDEVCCVHMYAGVCRFTLSLHLLSSRWKSQCDAHTHANTHTHTHTHTRTRTLSLTHARTHTYTGRAI